jgi:hypothetical protein
VMAMKNAPLKAAKPTQEEVEVAQAFTPPPATQAPAAKMPNNLPKTASPLPLIGLIGVLSAGTASLLKGVAAGMK